MEAIVLPDHAVARQPHTAHSDRVGCALHPREHRPASRVRSLGDGRRAMRQPLRGNGTQPCLAGRHRVAGRADFRGSGRRQARSRHRSRHAHHRVLGSGDRGRDHRLGGGRRDRLHTENHCPRRFRAPDHRHPQRRAGLLGAHRHRLAAPHRAVGETAPRSRRGAAAARADQTRAAGRRIDPKRAQRQGDRAAVEHQPGDDQVACPQSAQESSTFSAAARWPNG